MKQILISLALLLAAASCGREASVETDTTAAETTAVNADTSPANDSAKEEIDGQTSATAVANVPTFNGTIMISPKKHVTITLPMGGSLHSINLFPGEYVRQGTVLATLENLDFIGLQQNFLESASQTEFLEKEYKRQQTLASKEAASQKLFQRSKADYLAMKSKMNAAATQLKILGVTPDSLFSKGIYHYLAIKAPISGYVTNTNLNVGKYFNSGDPICDIIDKSAPLIQLTAYEKDLNNLKVGDKFNFYVNGRGSEQFKATLISIDQIVNESNRSINIYLRIDDPSDEFRPGMYVFAQKVK